jgi:hypothetical protein
MLGTSPCAMLPGLSKRVLRMLVPSNFPIFPSSNHILVRIEKMRRYIEVVFFAEWPIWSEFRYRERPCTPVIVMSSVVR